MIRFGEKLPLRQNIKVVGYFIRPHLVFGNILNLIRHFLSIEQLFIVVNGQILGYNIGKQRATDF